MSTQPQKNAGKVSVECPHCGFKQLESVFAKSTICRKCSSHFPLVPLKERDEVEDPAAHASLLKKFGTFIGGSKTRAIRCYECGRQQQVSSSAKSSICPHCATYLDLRDFKITTPFNRSIQTQGSVVVTSKGELSSSKVACGTAIIQGKLRGNLICSGSTRVKMKGKIFGAIDTHHLVIEKGSDVEFVRPLKVVTAEIHGKVSARITSDGVVKITKTGALDGTIYAKSITVDKGGIFHGELFIGRQDLSQPELLPEVGGGDFGLALAKT